MPEVTCSSPSISKLELAATVLPVNGLINKLKKLFPPAAVIVVASPLSVIVPAPGVNVPPASSQDPATL